MCILEGGDAGNGKCKRAATGREVGVWLSEGRGSGFVGGSVEIGVEGVMVKVLQRQWKLEV